MIEYCLNAVHIQDIKEMFSEMLSDEFSVTKCKLLQATNFISSFQ